MELNNMQKNEMDSDLVLEVNDLVIHYEVEDEVVRAVNGVNIRLGPQKTLGLVGETGAGKTSTALAIQRLLQSPPGVIKSGSIKVNGKDVLAMNSDELEHMRGKEVSMIFQDPMSSLNPVFTVGDQIAESIRIHEGLSHKEASAKAREMLEMVGISGSRADGYPHQFSGGMKQRVVIAIALACNPKLLIADEPTTALDVTIQAQVLDLIKRLKEQMGTSVIMITHDLGIVAQVCDEVAVMYAGRIVEQGNLHEVFHDTRHPYTEGLFNSIPNVKDRTAMLIPIEGLMPDPANLPTGCAFAPRCKYATPACSEAVPPLVNIGGTHLVACRAYEDPNFMIDRRK